jgi:L,D-transpeptidase catalytic domain
MNTRRHGASSPLREVRGALLGSVSAFGIIMTLALALGVSPAAARTKVKALHKEADRATDEPFGGAPKGPVQIFVSIDQQKLHVYSDGAHVADTSVATGVASLPTPRGVFSVIQKQVFHRSNLYGDAPMPFMQRITWSGVALHEGENIGHPASHGCIRMPGEFAARLYKFTRIGARVIVARGELKPADFVDPHLFVHKDMQAAAAPPALATVQTAQTIDSSKATDAGPVPGPDAAVAAKPADLGLRGSNANVAASFVLDTLDAAKPAGAVDAAKSDAPQTDAAKPDAKQADAVRAEAPKPEAPAAADAKAPASSDPKAEAATVTGSTPGVVAPVATTPETPVAPLAKPGDVAKSALIKKSPIAIFVSRKEKKIFVRQDFEPVFAEAITIEHPEEPLGTHVFTAMEYLADNTTFRWNVVSMPGEPPKASPKAPRIVADEDRYDRRGKRRHGNDDAPTGELPPPETPQQALARIDLPQDAVDFISQRMVPGSSLIVSDQGLGDETGEGTDFIVVSR